MRHDRFSITAVVSDGQTATITLAGPGGPVAATMSVELGEAPQEFRDRARGAVHRAIARADAGPGQRGVRARQALLALGDVLIARPDTPICTVILGVLSGTVEVGTVRCLLLLREADGTERECWVTPTKQGRLSVDLQNRVAVTLLPFGPEGAQGTAQEVF